MAAHLEKTRHPGVYRRGRKYVYVFRHDGRQRWGTAETLDEARRAKRQAEADADRGELVDLPNVRFGDYARDWVRAYQGRTSRGFRESTRRSYAQMLEARVIPYFDGVRRLRLAEIQPRDVKAFVRWMVEQPDPRTGKLLGKSTVRQHVAVLRALLGDAMEEGLLRMNPARGVRVVVPEGEGTGRPVPEERRAMTLVELRAVLDELPADWRLMFEFLAHTGLRIGEAVEVRWGRDLHLDGDRPHLRLRWQFADGRVCEPKTRYGRRDIPLSPGLVRKLRAAEPTNSDGRLVFASTFGTRLNRHNLYRDVLGPAVRRAGVPWVTFHTFRHTCASLLFAPVEHGGGGKNVKQVQEWLGHHSPAYTLSQYVHLVDAGVGAADFLDRVTAAGPAHVRAELRAV